MVVWATSWVSLFTDASSELVYALLPAFYATVLGLSTVWMGVIEGFAEALASVTKLVSGHWSDRTGGRKWWMVAGYSLSGLSKPLLPFAGGAIGAIILRGADRLGKGIRGTPRDAIISHEVAPEQRGRAFGLQRAMDHAGALLGSLIASGLLFFGVVQVAHLATLFCWTLLPSGLAVLLILLFVRERGDEDSSGSSAQKSLSLAHALQRQSPIMRRYLLVLAFFSLGNSTDALLLLRAQGQMIDGGLTLQRATAMMPLLWAWLHVMKSLSSTRGGQWSDRYGRRRLLTGGWLVYAAVYAGFALWSGALAPWVLFGIYGWYYGLVEGPERALVADICPDSTTRGTSFGLYHLVIGLLALPASGLCGWLWQAGGAIHGPRLAFFTGSALALLAALLLPWALQGLPASATQKAD